MSLLLEPPTSESSRPRGAALGALASEPRAAGALRRLHEEQEDERRAFLQARLRLVLGFLSVASAALLLVGRLVAALGHGARPSATLHPAIVVHLVACALAVAGFVLLRRPFARRTVLRAVDAATVLGVVGAALGIYALAYETGAAQVVPLVGLLLIARAVVVPSRGWWTLLLALPLPIGLLLVQLVHGGSYAYDGAAEARGAFVEGALWNQCVAWGSVAIAAWASRFGQRLRLTSWQEQQIERYTLEERIGCGAMGDVYRARHALLRRPTALKVLRPEIVGQDTLARFEAEVQLTSRLTHPNTVAIYDYGQTAEGLFYYAMELLDGADLEQVVATTGPLEPGRVVSILTQVCDALSEAHALGLVHRDVKPANIMLCQRAGQHDVVKVMDFGLAAETLDQHSVSTFTALCGTPLTMAPETIQGRAASPRTDLYALGVVGCYLLTGHGPFDVSTPGAYLYHHLHCQPLPPSHWVRGVPRDLEACLLACLAKDPAERPESAAALRACLEGTGAAGTWTRAAAAAWWQRHGDRVRTRPAVASLPREALSM